MFVGTGSAANAAKGHEIANEVLGIVRSMKDMVDPSKKHDFLEDLPVVLCMWA